ncbi:hypothetical protein [Stenotrophomonas sp. YIM B06876]|uniref:hypothetical protein n=1 Tax=Stenotrophomonas sp. YIM B06876 TaxID=3060211 RepID=UPI002738FA36|nr:hypothetical protein [Stenotrophomonas sp. YIM B06876]
MTHARKPAAHTSASATPARQDTAMESHGDGASRGAVARRLHDFRKAYGKARGWLCPPPRSFLVALRFALFGDSGRFRTHGGWRVSRIYKHD